MDELYAVNARAPLLLSQAAAPYLRRQQGCIVNLTDLHGTDPMRDHIAYTMAKAALEMATRSLALELAPKVRVNAVAPGAILWPEQGKDDFAREALLARTPLARIGTVEEIAEEIVRLVDDANEFHLHERHEGEILVSGTLGAQFIVWEYATAIAGHLLRINPFDQPDVESAKVAARGLLDARPAPTAPAFVESGVEVRVSDPALAASGSVEGVLDALWAQLPADGYVSIQAYVNRLEVPQLQGLRELVAADSGRPTTFGWGPRFLHSTGQYHKGGPAQGVYL